MGREGLLLFIWSIICPEANSKVKRESVPLPSGTGLVPVARGSIPDKVFEFGTFQVAWHHLALSKRSKCGGGGVKSRVQCSSIKAIRASNSSRRARPHEQVGSLP
jgi:hypothetical protein